MSERMWKREGSANLLRLTDSVHSTDCLLLQRREEERLDEEDLRRHISDRSREKGEGVELTYSAMVRLRPADCDFVCCIDPWSALRPP